MQQDLFNVKNQKEESATELSVDVLQSSGYVDETDKIMAGFLRDKLGERRQSIQVAAALLSAATRSGHTALDLERIRQDQSFLATSGKIKKKLSFVDFRPDDITFGNSVGKPDGIEPLVLDAGRLYWRRQFNYERFIAEQLIKRAEPEETDHLDFDLISETLKLLFGDDQKSAWPAAACAGALMRKLSVITGGPGTGKTYTVLRLAALLVAVNPDKDLTIKIAAPTGKAAARVKESVLQGLDTIPENLRRHIPGEASTLHRLLGTIHQSPHFRRNRENPINADIVIVDEASMIDLAMMAKLIDALHPQTHLILIGDRDQLASVEAGAVLADICSGDDLNKISKGQFAFLKKCGIQIPEDQISPDVTSLQDAVVKLDYSRRFSQDSGIGKLADAINKGNQKEVFDLFSGEADLSYTDYDKARDKGEITKELISRISDQHKKLMEVSDPEEAFNILNQFQILCAHRSGSRSSGELNGIAENLLIKSGNEWYHGKPVMITKNDYNLGLYNGDTGVVLSDGSDGLKVWFERRGESGNYISYHPAQLMQISEPCRAISVHKSQGSEFDEVVLVLPEAVSPVLTRELFYTAVTRARKKMTVYGNSQVIGECLAKRTVRFGGLSDRLTKMARG